MCVCVCVCVCVRVRARARVRVCLSVCLSISFIETQNLRYMSVYLCLSVCLSVCLSNFHIFLYIKANTGETKVTANEQQVSQLQLQLHK